MVPGTHSGLTWQAGCLGADEEPTAEDAGDCESLLSRTLGHLHC